MEEIRVKKEDVLRYAIERLEHFDAKHAVMVGDRMHDVAGAKEIGLDTVGVLYGYGNREELTNAGADEIVGSVKELEQLLTR